MDMVNLMTMISVAKTEKSVERTVKGQKDFSDQLAKALDKQEPTDKAELKNTDTRKTDSSAARDDSASAKDTATAAKDAAASAKDGTTSAKDAATSAKDAATSAKDEATSAKDEATSAKDMATAALAAGLVWLQPGIVPQALATEAAALATTAVGAAAKLVTGIDLFGKAGQEQTKGTVATDSKTGTKASAGAGVDLAAVAVDGKQENAVSSAGDNTAASASTAAGTFSAPTSVDGKQTADKLFAEAQANAASMKQDTATSNVIAASQTEAAKTGTGADGEVVAVTVTNTATIADVPNPAISVASQANTDAMTDAQNKTATQNKTDAGSAATTTLDPAVQGQVLSSRTATSTTANQVKPEEKPEDKAQEPLVNANGTVAEKTSAANEAKDAKQELAGQFAKENDQKTVVKKDDSAAGPVSFDKMMPVVDNVATPQVKAPEPRADAYEVARQVMEGMKPSTDRLQSSQVIITLKPEHLGEVTVKINVDGEKVTAAFHAASSEVRAILESSLPQLKQELSQQGWKFDSDGVFGGLQEFMGNQQQQKQQEQPVLQFPTRKASGGYDDAFAFTGNGNIQVMSAAAVDYRI